MLYRILIEQDEDGVFVAECPSLPGCISQGATRKEAMENIQDAIQEYLAAVTASLQGEDVREIEVAV